MVSHINLDEKAMMEVEELTRALNISRSKLIRIAVNELYLKEKRARQNLLFFVDLYNDGVIGKEMLFLLLPREDAEAVIIGAKAGKEGAEVVKNFNS